ncbi:mediator of RNA polymerase II transcription subunit 33A-like isoform X2 [Malus sylvestris]|uniref:mediator of RNA polymerase II transcription subunit 33A-like isoform X2 n=1 Tax=Malus sylvestris TaxID=3752 RepID=UPI0010AA06EB|nr:mediator of RNA polymerase II transcription subunit 33A-like isoform X2 [Malus domestica]XP_050132999.1 mediator of RNA polymerase II transcription subunit 33A-like isoform X2 [Malus sylvestris]
MEVSLQGNLWDSVVELTKGAQQKGSDPLLWVMQLSSNLNSMGVSLPSVELANVLVSHICWENNVPITWKFLEKALMLKIVPPMLVLALLSQKVIPSRRSQPVAYRLYMELLKRHIFTLKSQINGPNYQIIMKSIESILHLSWNFGLQASDPGILVVEFLFSIVWQLLDASLDDEGLLNCTLEKKSKWAIEPHEMEIDCHGSYYEKRSEYNEILQETNTVMAIEIIGKFLQNNLTSRILDLARRNLPVHWTSFIQRLQILGSNSLALRNSKTLTAEALINLTSDSRMVLPRDCKTTSLLKYHAVMVSRSLTSTGLCHGASRSALWLPLDLLLEDAMDGYQVDATSAVEVITGLIKTLRAINGTSWHDTFLGLWIAALRLVQRERYPIEGPVPRLDTRLCMLLSITTLVVADLIEEEEITPTNKNECGSINGWKEKEVPRQRRNDLVSSLQTLGDYQGLLTPPQCVVSAANQAAAKAMLFLSAGNMRHLIVESCIARNLLDTSAYSWPGYINGCINQLPHGMPTQGPDWSSYMLGATLTPAMANALVSSPASSLAELEKVFEVAVNGSNAEKISAATVLCGASLIRGWNIQEHTAHFIIRLLSPPVPANYSGDDSHLIGYAPMLNVLIVGIGSVDCVQIFSLHGLVPQLACSLMPICEVFGSCVPNVSWTLTTGEEISAHAVFSNAFTLLLKLWRFNHPPLEHGVGDVPTVASRLTPEYLLSVRNSYLVSSGSAHQDRNKRRLSAVASSSSPEPVFVDSFPKLKVWYRQHQACIASTLSGLVHGTPVHQIVDGLLNMMFTKINRGSQSLTSVNSPSSSSSGPGNEDSSLRPKLPAWDILEAVPFVVDAALTACAHGKLSPRELATGLKDLVDFLPASLATIVSYFSAEVTRGIWKLVFMNGTDWPSPAVNLSYVEEQIKKILAATGVHVPSLAAGGSSPATLPLPLAAFVSLTITYKIDRASERFLSLAGPTLECLAAGCPWPCMPIVASLWTQKAKRWSDFLVFSASRTVFLQNRDSMVQLLKSCFTATLGLNATPISSNGGVGALLGHGFGSHFCGVISPVAPGILYLRVYRSITDIVFMTEEIVTILMHSVREIACRVLPKERLEKLKTRGNAMRYEQVSLDAAMSRVKLAASLGASLVWLTGGLCLVQSLITETLPSWFISMHGSEQEQGSEGIVAMLGGYALAYFAVLGGAFAWGVDSSSSASKRRPKVLRIHMEFLASALDGKISLGCDSATWRAYVSGFVTLMVSCTPNWVLEVDVDVLRRLSNGLRQWGEEELALALLGIGGVGTMGAAAELIVENEM